MTTELNSSPGTRCGFVAVVGQPNVGKSTLVNTILGEKIAIATPKPQTTRTRILGVHTRGNTQFVFVDTPGVTMGQTPLSQALRHIAGTAVHDADVCLWMMDVSESRLDLEGAEARVRDVLKIGNVPVVVGLNKIDCVKNKNEILPLMQALSAWISSDALIPISAKKNEGVEHLLNEIERRLPEGPFLFDPEMHTDQIERVLCAELIREQLLFKTHQEVPHRAAVIVEEFDESERNDVGPGKRGMVRIYARVVVERTSQRAIILGKGGSKIKEIGTAARKNIEAMLDCGVYLKLDVKVDKDWTRDPHALSRYGVGLHDTFGK